MIPQNGEARLEKQQEVEARSVYVIQCFRVELQDNAGTGEASTVCKDPLQAKTVIEELG